MGTFSDTLADVALDTLKLVPFLFLTYLLMEYIERKMEDKSEKLLRRSGRLGPLLGAAAGIVPQCGFSATASSLFSGGIITEGTLIAVFLSTSDEMLPVMISEAASPVRIVWILAAKVVIGAVTGFLIDFIYRLMKKDPAKMRIHDLCEREHCGCGGEEEKGIIRPALKHTFSIIWFIFLVSLAAAFLINALGEDAIAGFLTAQPVIGVILTAFVGLIPNCGASVTITELYLKGLINTGQMMSGLLVGAGVGLLVLFRTNRHIGENMRILLILLAAGIFWGLVVEGTGIAF